MSKVAIVYWSGTGNTRRMAELIAEGAKDAGAEISLFTASEFSEDMVAIFDAIAFGCPSMGAEELEDSEFEPMFSSCKPNLKDKKIALFGSYGWGDGEWMKNWEADCRERGINLIAEGIICNNAPEDETKEACVALGKALV